MEGLKYIAVALTFLGALGSAQANAEVKKNHQQMSEKDTISVFETN